VSAKVGNQEAVHRERNTDAAINILYVLGFMSVGDGCTEAGRMLGLLGLPNQTTMESRSFTAIEERISPYIQQLTNDILHENLVEEVKASVTDPNFFNLWVQAQQGTLVLSKANYPQVKASYDMAWQQRNSGNRYNSPSGHALLVGGVCRKPLALVVKSKICNLCKTWTAKNDINVKPVPLHACTKNHEGTSGSMEAVACLEMVVDLFRTKHCCVSTICIDDDDASTRSMLKWSNADYMTNNNTTTPPTSLITKGPNQGKPQPRADKGRLPADIPEPVFIADPNHRKKVLTGELYQTALAVVSKRCTMTKNDSTRIGKNFGYMIRNLHKVAGDNAKMLDLGKAVVEHHFDNHEYCGRWCPRKRMSPQAIAASERFYRSKEKDAKLYSLLVDKVGRFVTLPRLKECAHQMDTQVNESFNNTVAWMAPKNKVYCGSCSLTNRLGIAVGIKSLGLVEYFKRLFVRLGINMTPNVRHYLQVKDKSRYARLAKNKTKEQKKARLSSRYDKQREDEATAKKERSKREGTYKTGQNVLNDGEEQQPAKKKARTRKDLICESCQQPGHATTRSRACLNYIPTASRTTTAQCMAVAIATPAYVLTEQDQAEDIGQFETFLLQEVPTPANPDVQVLAVTQQANNRTVDSDGEDIYDSPTPPPTRNTI
jgi:hypothetical protein